jgi:diacylglycerol kinase (ATP)
MSRIFSLIDPSILLSAFGNSLSGLAAALKSERAFQQELIVMIIGVIAAVILTDQSVERAVLIGSLAIVLIVELINSAIEATIDRIGPELHPLSKRAKDLGSAAVLVSIISAAAVWAIILI